MILKSIALTVLALSAPGIAESQTTRGDFPNQVLLARHTFFDFGPPFDFYEVISLRDASSFTRVERILITPAGNACVQPPSIEVKAAHIPLSLRDLMQGKNPCDIPEKALRQERKRCKHCMNFSGVNVSLGVSCAKGDRRIRAELLDADLFDSSAKTPTNTSWTMAILAQIDKGLGPGVMDRPAFTLNAPSIASSESLDPAMLNGLKDGRYDDVFDSNKKLSEIYRESLTPIRLPSVQITRITPAVPLSADPPQYPPIARAAHVEGEVSVSFEVSPNGEVEKISFVSGHELLRHAVSEAAMKWRFAESATAHHEEGTIAFRLNCPQAQP